MGKPLEEQGAVAAQVPFDGLARILRPVEGRDGVVGDLLRARLEGDGEIVGAGEIVQQPRPRLGQGEGHAYDVVHGARRALVVENVEAAAVVVLLEQLLESATGGGGIVVGDRPFEALRARRRRKGGATTRSIPGRNAVFFGLLTLVVTGWRKSFRNSGGGARGRGRGEARGVRMRDDAPFLSVV